MARPSPSMAVIRFRLDELRRLPAPHPTAGPLSAAIIGIGTSMRLWIVRREFSCTSRTGRLQVAGSISCEYHNLDEADVG